MPSPTAADVEPPREPAVWLTRALLGALVLLVVAWVVRRTTWYLAVDQFGYLTFASDLADGRVFHRWDLLASLQRFLPRGLAADVLGQTYVYREGHLYCRYAPGFPLLLAGFGSIFGEASMHQANAVALAMLLICIYWVGRKALGSAWLGLAAALLVTLLPNYLLLWSISPLRDVPTHLTALTSLGLLLPTERRAPGRSLRRVAAALLLGFAIATRVDAVLYAVPALGLVWLDRSWRRTEVLAGVIALLLGLSPLLAYNWIATGNPLRPTQAMELDGLLSRSNSPSSVSELGQHFTLATEATAAEPGVTLPRAARLLQGGGLKLTNLASTLAVNLRALHAGMGTLGIVLGLLGAIGALRVPRLFVLVVPYCVAATFFFSLWPRSDPRYLAGVFLLLPLLMLHGARVAAALPAVLVEQGHTGAGRAAILAVVVGVAWLGGAPRPAEDSALPWVTLAFQLCVPLSVILWPRIGREGQGKRVSILLALMLSGIAGWRSLESLGGRASFQQPQVAQARATIEAALAERPVVITSDEIGRPAENINYYTGASAVYLSELLRWGVAPGYFLDRLLKDGFSVYLLLPPADARLWLESPYVHPWFAAEPIASIPPVRNREYFVASPHHDGVPLLLLRIHPRTPAARE